ncbi:hypothetical protein Dda3937_04629 [Dickeya dadantii 3937]|uniref:Uncharacterized protein n=1 Tax=Dickeya dadantii (strain 3937) TaxID=198628 RepID=E0SHS9_DICD3|nr:hypothetical protein Dda3937_04629 [Dickeya dadantii 3937]
MLTTWHSVVSSIGQLCIPCNNITRSSHLFLTDVSKNTDPEESEPRLIIFPAAIYLPVERIDGNVKSIRRR